MADTPVTLPDEVKRELEEAASGGIGKIKEYIEMKNSEWKEIPLNIGITGESGVGKSSFINAIRGITADDEGGAHVDVVEATKEIKPYVHPKNESMILWDLPGVGTPNFPRAAYLEKVEFERFDFFLILSAGRFREDDLWLAEQVCKLDKKFHFVRTQMEVEVKKDKKGHPKTHNETKVIEKIRSDCLNNLEEFGLTKASVYLIDNYAPLDFDFNHLTTTLIDEAPLHKKEAMALSMSVLTNGVLEKKVEALNARISQVSILSAVAGSIPIPCIGAAVDGKLLLEEITVYKEQLGLDASSMEELARHLNTETKVLQQKLDLQSIGLASTPAGLIQEILIHVFDDGTKIAFTLAVPVISNLIFGAVSYTASVRSLKFFLKMCSDDARKINEELIKHALH